MNLGGLTNECKIYSIDATVGYKFVLLGSHGSIVQIIEIICFTVDGLFQLM